jgi:hypothetical protein
MWVAYDSAMNPEWRYTVTCRKFDPRPDWDGLQTDMDQMALRGWEMVNGSWYPGGPAAAMMAAVFWRKRVGPPPGTTVDDTEE